MKYTEDEVMLLLSTFGNFLRDNYYTVGTPNMKAYNIEKHKSGTVDEILEEWKKDNLFEPTS